MSAQQTIYDRIKGDLQDDKILQNVTLERLWYYFEVIKDITGSGGANFSYGAGEPSGGADGDYYIRTDATQIWYNNGGTWEVVLSPTPIPLTGDQFKALIDAPSGIINGQLYDVTQDGGDAYQLPVSITGMYVTGGNNQFLSGVLAKITLTGKLEYATYYTSDNDIFQNSIATMSVDLAQAYFTGNDIQNSTVIVNTDYIIDNSGATQLPTGISRIKGRAVLDPSGNVVWDKANCEAWVTALSTYVPCTYDVVTNKISCVLRTEGIFYGGATPSFVLDKSSTVGTLSVIENSAGDWLIASTADDFPASKTSCVVGSLSTVTAQSFVGDIIIIAASRLSDTKVQVISTSGVIGPYDYIGADGVRIEIHVNIGN